MLGVLARCPARSLQGGKHSRINCRRLEFVLQIVGLACDSENEELNQGDGLHSNFTTMQKGERTSIAQTPSEWSAAFTPPNMKQAERATEESGAEWS